MGPIIQIVVAIAAIVLFVWMLLAPRKGTSSDTVIDPGNPRQIGELIGLMGGSIEDATVAQFALRRFEQEHGRKATVKDMGVVAGMMRSGR